MDSQDEPSERLSLPDGLLRSHISCVEGRRSTTMRELKVQIGNSGSHDTIYLRLVAEQLIRAQC